MELKVWVEGIQRIVCGVTESTTCEDVVYALANATSQTGRFTLAERWRANERFLAPDENPVSILTKWKEYAPEVQFILRRVAPERNKMQNFVGDYVAHTPSSNDIRGYSIQSHNTIRGQDETKSVTPSVDLINSQGFIECNRDAPTENIAIVQPTLQSKVRISSIRKALNKNVQLSTDNSSSGRIYLPQKQIRELPPYRDPPGPTSPSRSLPPYREPPPPSSNSPNKVQLQGQLSNLGTPPPHNDNPSSHGYSAKFKKNIIQDFQENQDSHQLVSENSTGTVTAAYSQRYFELIRILNKQRDIINAQQGDLTKFDAEILYWETKNREQTLEMDFISQEVVRIEALGRVIDEQLNEFAHTEEDSEIVRQQEKTLKSEITLLRSKLANCETELLQCKNKIRLVMEELPLEQHNMSRDMDQRQMIERKMMEELEHLQKEVEHAKQSAELICQCAESLKLEVSNLEMIIVEKKMQVERLVTDMKEANLQSLTIACQDDQARHLLEGMQKLGSTRKIFGSPRQLETAVPTSKNPHGVWV